MTVTISGTNGIDKVAAGSVESGDIAANAVSQTTLAAGVAGTGPAFSYYQSVAQSMTANVQTKITYTSSEFDTTGGMFSSSRFTPTIAGYYQITARVAPVTTIAAWSNCTIYKNGSKYKSGLSTSTAAPVDAPTVTALVYCNGSTDYIEIYCIQNQSQNTSTGSSEAYFQGVLVRAA